MVDDEEKRDPEDMMYIYPVNQPCINLKGYRRSHKRDVKSYQGQQRKIISHSTALRRKKVVSLPTIKGLCD